MNLEHDLASVTLETLTSHMEAGVLSAVDLCQMSLERAAQWDGYTNAIVSIDPDALRHAERLDHERLTGKTRGPLHGIPIFVKDSIDTAGRLPTTAGSLALAAHFAARDADVVHRLRHAGAIVLAKTNLSEWSNFRSNKASSGWSSVSGQTRNPYSLSHSPGGSSSGSAVATTVGMCAAAVGTETDGSLVVPAAMSALVAIKPTVGRLSQRGIITLSHSYDTAGPIARTVKDAYLLLHCMGKLPASPAAFGAASTDGWPLKPTTSLKGRRIGIVETYRGLNAAEDAVVDEAILALRDVGAVPVEGITLKHLEKLDELGMKVICHEFRVCLARYLSRTTDAVPVKNLSDLIAFNELHAKHTMPFFGQDRLLFVENNGALEETEYLKAKEEIRRLAGTFGIDQAIRKHKLDALAARTIGRPWKIDLESGDNRSPGAGTWAALAGYPSVSVPAGYVDGLPIGMLFFGTAFSEPLLISVAHAFEQATLARKPPPTPIHQSVLRFDTLPGAPIVGTATGMHAMWG
jgi:amidase